MSILSDLKTVLSKLNIPLETGSFKSSPPDEYIVLTPITDNLDLFSDNAPSVEVSEVRISLFSKTNYIKRKNQITKLLLESDFTITGRWYVEYEQDTGYHHYTIDAAKHYEIMGGI
nr:MAG TPA: tail component [Caudoviricetes sp.]